MMELLFVAAFFWLFFKGLGLFLRLTWSVTKVIASLLFGIAVPLLIVCALFAGGIALMLPLALVGIAFGLLKACA